MPILKLPDGTSLAQSRAITRYLGTVVTYSGAPLYPTDPLARYNADQLIELCEDMRSPIGATFAIKDQAEKEAARQALFARPDGKSAKWLKVLDAQLAKDPMTTLTIGNVYAFCIVNMFRPPTFLDGLNDADIIDGYDNLKKHHNWIATLPEVKAYYAGRDDRAAFQPIP